MAIVISNKAVEEFGAWTVRKPHHWNTAFFAKNFGSSRCRRAKLITDLPFGFALFWTYGKGWIE